MMKKRRLQGKSLLERFLLQVVISKEGCWEWIGSKVKGGYGALRLPIGGVSVTAHRAAYLIFWGPIPPGLGVCHKCDNTRCCRPDHLFLGTQRDNMRDASVKGRFAARRPHYHFNSATIVEIRRRVAGGECQARLARELGMHKSYLNLIVKGKRR